MPDEARNRDMNAVIDIVTAYNAGTDAAMWRYRELRDDYAKQAVIRELRSAARCLHEWKLDKAAIQWLHRRADAIEKTLKTGTITTYHQST